MHPSDNMIDNYINNGEMYIMKDDEKIVGMMAVTPAYQKKGIAKDLISYVESIAKKNGKKAVRLDALDTNTKARRLYENEGYQFCGISKIHTDNLGIADFYMYEKIL